MKLTQILTCAALALTAVSASADPIPAKSVLGFLSLDVSGAPALGTGFGSGKDPMARRGRRPRVPGGSGCDSPRDLIQHPECRR